MSAGWYQDPSVPGQQRYWDGSTWTAHVAPGLEPAAIVPAQAAYPTYAGTRPGYAVAPQAGYAVAPKNPALSLLVSFFIPGVGSMMNGEVGKGIGILVGYLVSFVLIVVVVGIVGVLGFWIWGMVDAYTGAQRWNREHGILS